MNDKYVKAADGMYMVQLPPMGDSRAVPLMSAFCLAMAMCRGGRKGSACLACMRKMPSIMHGGHAWQELNVSPRPSVCAPAFTNATPTAALSEYVTSSRWRPVPLFVDATATEEGEHLLPLSLSSLRSPHDSVAAVSTSALPLICHAHRGLCCRASPPPRLQLAAAFAAGGEITFRASVETNPQLKTPLQDVSVSLTPPQEAGGECSCANFEPAGGRSPHTARKASLGGSR